MLDVDFGDLIDFLGNDPEVQSILLYMEQLTNHRKFMSAARAVARLPWLAPVGRRWYLSRPVFVPIAVKESR